MKVTPQTKMNLRIIRVIYEPVPGVGGSIRHTVDLYKNMDPHLQEQYLINPVLRVINEDNSADSLNIIRTNKSRLLGSLPLNFINIYLFSKKSVKIIKQITNDKIPTIIHVHGLLLGLYLSHITNKKRLAIPVVIMVHGRPSRKDTPIGFSYNLCNLLMKIIHPAAYILLDDGSEIHDLEKRIGSKTSVTCVNHAFDFREFSKTENAKKDTFRILFPHRLIPIKSPEIALKVLKLLISRIQNETGIKNPNVKLVFLDSKGYNRIINNLKLKKYVEFAGMQNVEGMKKQYNLASVVIGTSLSSNMSRSIQEAMACEIPVVTFSSGRMDKLIDNKINGYLVNPEDINGMVDALYTLYKNPKTMQIIGKNARRKLLTERSWEKRVETELGVYRLVMAQNIQPKR